jgi:hypothetical protein
MAKLQDKTIHFWAYCPWCPENSHQAGFPVTGKVSFEVDWKGTEVSVRTEFDTRQIRAHMEQLHPDKVSVNA